ncbi:MAG TPA: aldehyde dehydrogenase family protein [Bryobacteraceae bacterium]|jgi:aldehyde dehydrogenase (NAD+)|nr:aldehyde dehydrogenase family protein [Bryobacteraceae bacterium]
MNVTVTSATTEAQTLLDTLGVPLDSYSRSSYPDATLRVVSPITGETLAHVRPSNAAATIGAIERAHEAFLAWRAVPAPRRGEFVRLLGEELRAAKASLGRLVTLEAGKILSEGLGEVQEMIDICDFAAGLSRQLYGLTTMSERPLHHMRETWHPLGPVGIISAFNFPVAVWAWNAAIALACGDSILWKPSEKTPLTALAVQAIFDRAAARFGNAPQGLSQLIIGGRETGEILVDHPLIPLVSATGSTAMGRSVAPRLAARFARAILELGGNNAAIVCPTADLDLTTRAVAFAAMGTAGQRCTSLRRLIVHESVYDDVLGRLKTAYASVPIGDPREPSTLIGPLIDEAAFLGMQRTLTQAAAQAGVLHGGERVRVGPSEAFYVRPALVEIPQQSAIVKQETFAPILYLMRYQSFPEAIALHNDVPQGLSSSIFTNDVREAERFLSSEGSDCGIANVNIGPSGAEIGGAFGGEKETGGGREAGSDAWKLYMRRATNTVNYGSDLPLAQGVKFTV